ncbi:MAG: DUF3365 domain-containing protein [Ignavibacteriales bacterium]|nr:MAG: DUF3365 domain-containing protein [Ignavibacteriales bacterium]
MLKYWQNLNIKKKILMPLIIISVLTGVLCFWFFYDMYKESEVNALVSKARALIIEAEAVREYTAKQSSIGIFRNDITNLEEVLYTVPIFSAMTVVKDKSKELEMDFKVPKFQPRNPDNEPDAYETEILKKLESSNEKEFWEIDEETNTVRFFRPIKLTDECLKCHGDPEKSLEYWGRTDGKDITGAKMENWKVGEVHGAFELKMSMEPVNATVANKSLFIAVIFAVGVGVIIFLGIFISKNISEPIGVLHKAALRVASGELKVNVDIRRHDEIGELADSFNAMSDKITQQMEDLDGLPSPLMMIDPDFNITYFNKAAAEVAGKDQKTVIGQKCYDQFKTDHCRTANCATHKAMLTKSAQTAETFARPQGKEIPIAYAAKANLDKNGNVIGALEFVADLTKAKEHENYLNHHAQKMLVEMEKFAKGDLSVGLKIENKDDLIGKLFTGFNQVVDNIRNIIVKVTEAVQATASAANQISSSTEEMAAGAQEQSSQATEVAGAVEQMTKTIYETTKNTVQATEASKNAGVIAKEGGHVVEETIIGMNRIAEVVRKSADTVQELGKSSDQIGEIVQVIDDIADQTNLLALNAAIEAARAGEQGRGFAVVADEVRKLAERTSKATKEIAAMIKQIQKDTGDAVDSMQEGTKQVEDGKLLAEKAGASLEEIIIGAERVVDIVTQVAAASEEQSSAAEQISKNIESISSVTQESASGIQQIAHASEDLNRLTLNLQELIAQFKLDNSSSGNLAVRQNGKLVHI